MHCCGSNSMTCDPRSTPSEAVPRALHLDDDLFGLQQEIHAAATAGIAFAAHASFMALLKITGEATPEDALKKLEGELGDAIEAMFQWTAGVQIVALKKMLGLKPPMRPRRIEEHEYLPQDKISFPFFMTVATNFKPKRKRR
jgi:hypothetical protein